MFQSRSLFQRRATRALNAAELQLVTAVAYPVVREIWHSDVPKCKAEREERDEKRTNRTHQYMGVAGVTVPLADLKQMAPVHRVGTLLAGSCSQMAANGYSFMVDNNGYTMYHPMLRPYVRLVEQTGHRVILKPNHKSVDILELEGMEGQGKVSARNSCSQCHEIITRPGITVMH